MGQVFVNSAWHNHDEISVFERRRRLRENDALLQKKNLLYDKITLC